MFTLPLDNHLAERKELGNLIFSFFMTLLKQIVDTDTIFLEAEPTGEVTKSLYTTLGSVKRFMKTT